MSSQHIVTRWAKDLPIYVEAYLERLSCPEQLGRYRPVTQGATQPGSELALGFSCFALKLYLTLGLWDRLPLDQRDEWIAFIKRFQSKNQRAGCSVCENSFIDPTAYEYLRTAESVRSSQGPSLGEVLRRRASSRAWLLSFFRRPERHPSMPSAERLQRYVHAETKQAIATLADIGEEPTEPYHNFETDPHRAATYLDRFDWSAPWGAGAHFAALCAFAATQGPRLLSSSETLNLQCGLSDFIKGKLDTETGAYFSGPVVEHGQLINGAMKVLTGLNWLGEPIHSPERLIDACLRAPPRSDGCHMVDVVYVLHSCAQQTKHRRPEVETYCADTMNLVSEHYIEEEGGFSYHVGKSQTSYYGVPFSEGLPIADIHGTILLVWACSMILDILDEKPSDWAVIRP